MLVSNEVISIIGAIGLLSLAISWHRRESSSVWLAQIGWVFVGLFFFNDASLYYAHDDLILTLFSVMALPMAGGMALWEHKADDERTRSSLVWARGAVAYAGGPYLLIAHVPWLSVIAIWFVAGQAALFLRVSGGDHVVMGDTWVNTNQGQVTWEEFDGNRWFMGSSTEEYMFQTEFCGDEDRQIINFQ